MTMDILQVILTSILSLVALFLLAKLMGCLLYPSRCV